MARQKKNSPLDDALNALGYNNPEEVGGAADLDNPDFGFSDGESDVDDLTETDDDEPAGNAEGGDNSHDDDSEIPEEVLNNINKNSSKDDDTKGEGEQGEGLTEDETDMFDIHELLFPKKFKIVEVNLSKEVRTTLMVAMPMDADDDDVMDFIDHTDYIEPEDDTDDWEVDSVYVDMDNLDREELRHKDIWNCNDIDDI